MKKFCALVRKWIFKKWDGGMDWIDLAQDRDRWGDSCKHDNEPPSSRKCGEFFD
jgi:hypothetical protein